jgi:hypothetical protein
MSMFRLIAVPVIVLAAGCATKEPAPAAAIPAPAAAQSAPGKSAPIEVVSAQFGVFGARSDRPAHPL